MASHSNQPGPGAEGQGEKDPPPPTSFQNPLSEISPSPSPSSTTMSALVLSTLGKRIDQAGKKKYVKQVTGRHNDTELHLEA
ncbi:Ankyrin repeat-containing protein ITN1 [Glycine soja]|uniref:Ankyrin repeat-containing protein ITN1 n=1 Tax=Glycine soja TaxID=3848 RepID=A0A445GVA3_GLYSO|nr:Ankyrin repeat-containing protein ITN1 [Glycine soja]